MDQHVVKILGKMTSVNINCLHCSKSRKTEERMTSVNTVLRWDPQEKRVEW